MRSVFRVAFAFVLVAPLILSAGEASAGSSQQYAALIATHAAANGVPMELAQAVVRYESNYNPRVTGRAGEIGLMQIKLQTARGLGYRGSRQGLYDPATNIAWGMKYLGQAHQLSSGSECGTLSRYNGGLFTKRLIRSYCRQVIALR
jgi:soluble lytic murein transglycosylase-like protein